MGYDMYMRDTGFEGGDDAYFRANIWGMGSLRRVMTAAGVLDWDGARGEFPEPPEELQARMEEGDEEAERAWDDKLLPFLGQRSGDPKKVPGFKFCSNDGWWVTPEECELIAAALGGEVSTEALEAEIDRYNEEHVAWMREAKLLEGELTPERCRALVQQGSLQSKDAVELSEMVEHAREFADYCRRAAPRGGFRVY